MQEKSIFHKFFIVFSVIIFFFAVFHVSNIAISFFDSTFGIEDEDALSAQSGAIIKNFTITQLPAVPGQPIKWVKTIKASTLNKGEYLLELPKTADRIKVTPVKPVSKKTSKIEKNVERIFSKSFSSKTITLTNKDRIKLAQEARLRTDSKESLALAKSFKNSVKTKSNFLQYMLASVEDAIDSLVETQPEVVQPFIETPAPEVILLDLTTETPAPIEEVIPTVSTEGVTTEEVTPVVPAEEVAPVVSTEEVATAFTEETTPATETTSEVPAVSEETNTTSADSASSSQIETTPTVSTEEVTEVVEQNVTQETVSLPNVDLALPEVVPTPDVQVEYETPAPTIAETETDTGKIVQVSAPDTVTTTTTGTTAEQHITNVLAFTNIPEIYKVGQESRIKIKWTNNDDQPVEFHAYDLNGNGKLDYVEWTVPHLSTQTFEIIFISKAFRLDTDQTILEDIYSQVQTQDGNYASITNGQYVRVTFAEVLDNTNDNTIYAKPTDPSQPVTIEVYPVYTDQDGNQTEGSRVAIFSSINHEGTYKVLLTNLITPTNLFDLKVVGGVDIDYIVDPSATLLHYLMNDNASNTTVADGSGNSYNGTASVNTSSVTTTGKINGALSFSAGVASTCSNTPTTSYCGDYTDQGSCEANNFHGGCTSNFAAGSCDNNPYLDCSGMDESTCNTYSAACTPNSTYMGCYSNGLCDTWDGQDIATCTATMYCSMDMDYGDCYPNIDCSMAGEGDCNGIYADICDASSSFSYCSTSGSCSNFGGDNCPTSNGCSTTPGAWSSCSGTATCQNDVNYCASESGCSWDPGTPTNYVSIPNTNVPTGSNPISISAWVYRGESCGAGCGVVGIGPTSCSTDNQHLALGIPAGGNFTIWHHGGSYDWDTGSAISSGAWHHLVYTSSGTHEYAYLDGTLLVDRAQTASISSSPEVRIGSWNDGCGNLYYLDGAVDDVRIFNFTLSQANIDFIYNSGTGTESALVLNITPSAPTLVSPANASYTTDNTPTLSANYTDSDTGDVGTTNYRISSGTAQNCLDNANIVASGTSSETADENEDTTWTPSSTIGNDGTYYWCAQNNDGVATSSWTSMGNFVLDATNPSITITSPTNSASYNNTSVSISSSASDTHLGNLISNLDSGLTAWWRMDDIDGSGNPTDYMGSYNGTKYGHAAQVSDGKFGKSFTFDGTDDYVLADDISLTSNTVSACVWVKIASSNTAQSSNMILAKWDSGISKRIFGLFQTLNTNTITFATSNTGAYQAGNVLVTTSSMYDGAWHHICGIHDGSYNYLYVDGDLDKSVDAANGLYNSSLSTSIGCTRVSNACQGNDYFNGLIDDAMIYTRALTSDEVKALYNGTAVSHSSTLAEGSHTYKAYAQDTLGNINSSGPNTFSVDTVAPATPSASPAGGTYDGAQSVTLSSSGSSSIYYTLDGSTPTTGSTLYTTAISISTATTLKALAVDLATNQSGVMTESYSFDVTAPTTTATATSNGSSYTFGDWTPASVSVTLSCADNVGGTGCAANYPKYCLDTANTCTPTTTYASAVSISTEGTSYIRYFSQDAVPNIETVKSSTIKIDTSTPVISSVSPADGGYIANGESVTFSLSETGDCRLALSDTAKSYDQMSGDTLCSVTNGIQMSCVLPTLGNSGDKNIYLACNDSYNNKDTALTATHMSYVLRRSGSGGSSSTSTSSTNTVTTPIAEESFSLSINNGATTTDNRQVNVSFSSSNPNTLVNAVIIANNPDFSNTTTVPFVSKENSFNLCGTNNTCPDSTYTVYAKFLDSNGFVSPAISKSITLNVVPLATEVIDTVKTITENVTNTASEIVNAILPTVDTESITYPPIEVSVPTVAQGSLQSKWRIVVPSSMKDFVFADLPKDFQTIVDKFPQVSRVLQKVGITSMNDASSLNVASLSLPGLTESTTLPSVFTNGTATSLSLTNGIATSFGLAVQNLPISSFSAEQKSAIPTDVIFARTSDEKIDLNIKLSLDQNGLALQTLNTIQGQNLKLIVKPDGPAKSIEGYLLFKSNAMSKGQSLGSALTANVANAMEITAESEGTVGPDTDLVLNKFFFKDSGSGIWTADVASPLATGQYELKTVVNYKANKTPKQLSMVVVVDPEGYVYQRLNGGEFRIVNASVSIYVLNENTKEYSLWPATDYRQKNPQNTDVTGRYAFLVPAGTYYISVNADNYYEYKGEPFKVEENKGVFINIELKPKLTFSNIFTLQNIFLGIISLALIYMAVAFTVCRTRKL